MRFRSRKLPAALTSAALQLVLWRLAAAGPVIMPPPPEGGGGTGGPATIVLPPGADQLAAAVRAAGAGGRVILAPGRHTESSAVTLTQSVTLTGEAGAVLESAAAPATAAPLEIHPALRVLGAGGVRIEGLELRPPAGRDGGTAILIEDAPGTVVAGNTIVNFQIGVLVRSSVDAAISDNTIAVDPGGLSGALPEAHGIVIVSGRRARIDGNTVSNATFGLWVSDLDGEASGNTLTGSGIGLILRRVPEGHFLISGSAAGSVAVASSWEVRDNLAIGNGWGYLIGDGAHDNALSGNAGRGNGRYDLELTGPTDRFGRALPATYDNRVATYNDKTLVIKDCGERNRLLGAARSVSTDDDPCV